MKVLNCPHCGYPPIMQTFPVRMKKIYNISCPIYACDMPYCAIGSNRVGTIMAWNRVVKKELERIKR